MPTKFNTVQSYALLAQSPSAVESQTIGHVTDIRSRIGLLIRTHTERGLNRSFKIANNAQNSPTADLVCLKCSGSE